MIIETMAKNLLRKSLINYHFINISLIYMHEQFNFAIEVLGTIAFSMSGSFAAMQKRLDPFGVLIIAFVTSVGGGTVRDLLLDIPVFWMHDLLMCPDYYYQYFLHGF
jgi:hypothetical protein